MQHTQYNSSYRSNPQNGPGLGEDQYNDAAYYDDPNAHQEDYPAEEHFDALPPPKTSAELLQQEAHLNRSIVAMQRELVDLDGQLDDAQNENYQLQTTVEQLRDMRDQLNEELATVAAQSNVEAEKARFQSNEIRKTLLENELVQCEETLRLLAHRIQDLVHLRMERDAEAEAFVRRVQGMHRVINRPRGPGTTSSAARELKQLEQENRNLEDHIIALRAATGGQKDPNANAGADGAPQYQPPTGNDIVGYDEQNNPITLKDLTPEEKEQYIEEQLLSYKITDQKLNREEQLTQLGMESRIASAEQRLADEHQEKIKELTLKFEAARNSAIFGAKSAAEKEAMEPKALLTRALEETKASQLLRSIKARKGGDIAPAAEEATPVSTEKLSPKEIMLRALAESKKRVAAEAPVGPKGVRVGEEDLQDEVTVASGVNGVAADAPLVSGQTASQVSFYASERCRTSAVAKSIAQKVHIHQALADENSALLSLLNKMSNDLRSTNDNMRQMATQLEVVQQRLKDETNHRQSWIELEANALNDSFVHQINEKDEELRAVTAQIAELRSHTERLQRISPATQAFLSPGGVAAPGLNSSFSKSPLPPNAAPRITSSSAALYTAASPLSQRALELKKSMMLDL